MADHLTHRDLAGLCGVSETTIKSYRRKFPGFIPVLTRGKPIRFRPEAGEVCLRIRQCFEKGLSVSETEQVLAREFRKEPSSSMPGAASDASRDAAPQERFDAFFRNAERMMQGMAALATAQAKSDRRLQVVEEGLARLVEVQAENKELLGDLMRLMGDGSARGPEPRAARKIVTVRKPGGQTASYAFDAREAPATEPPAETLDLPVVIHTEEDQYLGLPGGRTLRDFVDALAARFNERPAWEHIGADWRMDMAMDRGETHSLHFRETTTPKGNNVIQFHRLDLEGNPGPAPLLQDLFRRVKRWL